MKASENQGRKRWEEEQEEGLKRNKQEPETRGEEILGAENGPVRNDNRQRPRSQCGSQKARAIAGGGKEKAGKSLQDLGKDDRPTVFEDPPRRHARRTVAVSADERGGDQVCEGVPPYRTAGSKVVCKPSAQTEKTRQRSCRLPNVGELVPR